jgi:hypothetical protein
MKRLPSAGKSNRAIYKAVRKAGFIIEDGLGFTSMGGLTNGTAPLELVRMNGWPCDDIYNELERLRSTPTEKGQKQ